MQSVTKFVWRITLFAYVLSTQICFGTTISKQDPDLMEINCAQLLDTNFNKLEKLDGKYYNV